MEGLEELEDDLFGTISRRKNISPNEDATKSNRQSTTGIKKKVVFHDFNEDDPLADLLSDEEDFQTNPSANIKGSLVSDLFGIRSTNSSETNIPKAKSEPKSGLTIPAAPRVAETTETESDDWVGLSSTSPKTVSDETYRPRAYSKIDAQSNSGITSGISDRINSAGDRTKKSSLMEDLFGSKPRSNVSKDTFIVPKDPVVVGLDMPDIQKKSEQLSRPNTAGYAPSLSAPRDGRRSRKSSGGIVDPLGMFSSSNVELESPAIQSSEVNASKSDHLYPTNVKDSRTTVGEMKQKLELPPEELPEWLGGSKKSNEPTFQAKRNLDPSNTMNVDKSSNTTHKTAENLENTRPESSLEYPHNHPEYLSLLTGTQFDQQATIMSLQQQEHELKTAVTLSRQSEQLNKMIESQKKRLDDQEKQFNILIKKQLDRQGLLEAQMKAQQDRINCHLQVLLAQPTSVPFVSSSIGTNNDLSKNTDEHEKNQSELEGIVHRLEAEKISFENVLDRLRDQHSKEIALIEESYTRQIEIVNQAAEKLEKRLRQDMESTEADYEARIEKMKEEHGNLEIAHGEEIEKLKKEHVQHIQQIKDQQHRNLQLVQNEYIETIESISKAKEIERKTISEATVQTANLNDTLEIIKVTIAEIGDLKIKLEENTGESNRANENILKRQIEELKDLKEHLKKRHEALELDEEKSTEAIRRLDAGALRLISEFDKFMKENVESQNKLKSREEILMREKELLDTQIQWERNHIETMKEAWIKEQQRQVKQLSDERNSIAAERAKLETLQRLKLDDNDIAKTELDAALRTVRDASNLVNQERQKWREKLNELEIQKQQIKEKENSLTLRAKELENLTQSALEKREEGLRALKEAHYLEEQHKAYLSQLQMQSEALAQRENKLAAEKLTLARERLALRVSQTDKPEKDTGKASGPVSYIMDHHSHYHHPQCNDLPDSQMTTHFKDIVDPRLVLLKLGLDNELDVTNDCLGTMQSITE